VGAAQDNAGTFNITDNLEAFYFYDKKTFELLHMHKEKTGNEHIFRVT
jgi:hypothetical protein